jgi:hypothetical protein
MPVAILFPYYRASRYLVIMAFPYGRRIGREKNRADLEAVIAQDVSATPMSQLPDLQPD